METDRQEGLVGGSFCSGCQKSRGMFQKDLQRGVQNTHFLASIVRVLRSEAAVGMIESDRSQGPWCVIAFLQGPLTPS